MHVKNGFDHMKQPNCSSVLTVAELIFHLTSKLPFMLFKTDLAALVPSLCNQDLTCGHADSGFVLRDYPVLFVGRGRLLREFGLSYLFYGKGREEGQGVTQ